MTLRYVVENIPQELKAIDRWCVFQIVPQPNGKAKKLPLVPGTTGHVLAKCDDSTTLRPFAAALRNAEVRALHLAFAFCPDLPYFFIDADDVLSGDGDDIRPDVRQLRDTLDTYTEVSASGSGLHIIGRGAFPANCSNLPVPAGCKALERYPLHGGRFCVMTGDVLPGFETIGDRGDVLARLFPARERSESTNEYRGAGGELRLSEGAAIVRWAGQYWTDGRRHAMALHLSGYLGKQGVSRDQAVRIIEKCSANDADPGAKIHACHDSYDALEAGDVVSGWQGLVDVCGLSEQDLATLNATLDVFWQRNHPQGRPNADHAPAAPGEPAGATERSGIVDLGSAEEGVRHIWEHGYDPGVSTGFPHLDEFYRPRLGTFTVVCGIPGHGKSSWMNHLMVNLAHDHGWKFALCAPESGTADEISAKLIQIANNRPIEPGKVGRMDEHELTEGMAWVRSHFWLIDGAGDVDGFAALSVPEVLRRAEVLVRDEGIQGLVIDPWNQLDSARPRHMSETEHIAASISTCQRFAKAHRVHVWIVAHPTKMPLGEDREEGMVHPYNTAGSAAWYSMCDQYLGIARGKWTTTPMEVRVWKIKHEHTGQLGSAFFEYDYRTRRFRKAEAPLEKVGANSYTQPQALRPFDIVIPNGRVPWEMEVG